MNARKTLFIAAFVTVIAYSSTQCQVFRTTGAVIVAEDANGRIKYNNKCQACGYVEKNITRETTLKGNSGLLSSFRCFKCGKTQSVEIKITGNTQSRTTPNVDKDAVQAYAVEGAVIAKQDARKFWYYHKCESCGFSESNIKREVLQMTKGTRRTSYFRCPKCSRSQHVEIVCN